MNKILISKQLLRSRIALIAFLCIFPLDAVFYVLRTVYGLSLPAIGLPSAIMVWIFLLPHIKLIKGKTFSSILLFVGFLVIGAFSASFSQFFDFAWLPLYFWYVTFFVLGYHFSSAILLRDKIAEISIIISSLISSIILIAILKDGIFYSSEPFNYLRTASSIFYSSLLALSIKKNIRWSIIIYLLTAFALFFVNSRNSFFLWIFLPIILFFIKFRFSWRTFVYALMLTVTIFVIGRNLESLELDPNIRIFRLVLNSENDSSLQQRLFVNSSGWEQIQDNPIFGYYNGFFLYGESGLYIHNILSYWHQFGLFAFISILLLIGFATRKAFSLPNNAIGLYLKLSLVTCIIGLIMAKSYTDNDIFFLIGLSVGVSSFEAENTIKPV